MAQGSHQEKPKHTEEGLGFFTGSHFLRKAHICETWAGEPPVLEPVCSGQAPL